MNQITWRRSQLFLVGGGLALLLAIAGIAAAADSLRVWEPSKAIDWSSQERPLAVPVSYPSDSSGYANQASGVPLRHPGGQPVAYVAALPDGVVTVDAKFFPQQPVSQDEVAFHYVASLRYVIDGHTVYLVTSQPTPKAAEQELLLGNEKVDLGGGRVAYISLTGERKGADRASTVDLNRVAFLQEGLVVTLTSDLPMSQLVTVARGVQLGK